MAGAGGHSPRVGGNAVSCLSKIEKVIILKAVSIFTETPADILTEVASLLDEVKIKAGESIFEEGDFGDAEDKDVKAVWEARHQEV